MYSLNLILAILDRLPPLLRQTRLVAYLEAILSPLSDMADNLPDQARSLFRQARWNGQRAIMEAALREVSGESGLEVETVTLQIPRLRIWFITENQPPLYIYTVAEAQPPLYIYTVAELAGASDFLVHLPTGSTADTDLIRQWVNRLKLAGKRYEIDYI